MLTAPDDEYLAMRRARLKMIEGHDIERTLSVFESLYRGQPVVPSTDAASDRAH